jgi:hypothetical protein
MKHFLINLGKGIIVLFAIIGFTFTGVFFAMKFGFTKTAGLVDTQNDFWASFKDRSGSITSRPTVGATAVPLGTWVQSDEWKVLKQAIVKDESVILNAAYDAHIEPRMVVAQIVAEQLRLFTSERDVFKQVFQPLRVLGTQTQFSLGVTGVKEETAARIEQYLVDTKSVWYPGAEYVHLLDYSLGANADSRIGRFSDEHNHYYSYLYTALFIREIETQWKSAGFDISNRPEILATIFNLGFDKSIPKANPVVGGAQLTINGQTYSFGGLAGEFYYSDELITDFPREGK